MLMHLGYQLISLVSYFALKACRDEVCLGLRATPSLIDTRTGASDYYIEKGYVRMFKAHALLINITAWVIVNVS